SKPMFSPAGLVMGSRPVISANMSVSTEQNEMLTSMDDIERQAGTLTQISPAALRTSMLSLSLVCGLNSTLTKPLLVTCEQSPPTGAPHELTLVTRIMWPRIGVKQVIVFSPV